MRVAKRTRLCVTLMLVVGPATLILGCERAGKQSSSVAEAAPEKEPRYTSRYTITLSTTYFQGFAVPSVLFHVVESTYNPLTVTATVVRSVSSQDRQTSNSQAHPAKTRGTRTVQPKPVPLGF
jgi:hypothetical protein